MDTTATAPEMAPPRFLPTRDLPPAGRATPAAELADALARLQRAYGVGHAREEWIGEPSTDAAPVLDDTFETQYVRSWLHALIQRGCRTPEAADLVDPAAALLVQMAGQAASGSRWCVYRFFTHAGPPRRAEDAVAAVKIHDAALVEDALGVRTWGAAPYLARYLLQHYAAAPCRPRRALELGAGTGLVGLAWAQWMATHTPDFEVVLTDHHATVLANLALNAEHNALPQVRVQRLDWQAVYDAHHGPSSYATTAQTLPDDNDARAAAYGTVADDARFDLLIAADCIYDPWHARWLAAVAAQHLARPCDATPPGTRPQFHLLMPARSTHTAELHSVASVFAPPSALRITDQRILRGTDDFGPAQRHKADASVRTGASVTYHHWVVEWIA